ncbi:MAG: NADP-dependent oxidoreductase [Streptosporangiaceae bacterium]|nr:NADP-dependent oxidoreductase [Streptosporangiaceae bacterium]
MPQLPESPKTMRALRFGQHGGPDVVEMVELPVPVPGPGEVLLRVRAAALNPVDVGIVAIPLPFVPDLRLPAVPGWDVAGTVVAVGAAGNEITFGPGDEVFGLSRFPRLTDGTFAEYTTVPATDLARKPPELSWEQAGAVPLVGLTTLQAFEAIGAFDAVRGMTTGTRLLIEAAAGGVGHVAAQIAKAAGATVIGTASKPRHEFLRSIGVDVPIDYSTTSDVFAAAAPVHGALLSTSANAVKQAVRTVEPGGFVVSISPPITPEDAAIADERGVRHAAILVAADGAGMSRLADLISQGHLRAHVTRAYPLDRAVEAFEQVKSRRTVGKIVLTP